MTKDQRNDFVELLSDVQKRFVERRRPSSDEHDEDETKLRRMWEMKLKLGKLRLVLKQAEDSERLARDEVREAESRVSEVIRKARNADSDRADRELDVFIKARAELLAVEDPKEAQKFIERLIAL